MELLFTRTSGFQIPVNDRGDTVEVTTELGRELGLIEGVPFVIRDNGFPAEDLNLFFREYATYYSNSPHTWKTYGYCIFTFAQFLKQKRGGKWLWDADLEDTAAYYEDRRMSENSSLRKASSWKTYITILHVLFKWAVSKGYMKEEPFRMRQSTYMGHHVVSPTLIDPVDRETITYTSLDDYKQWRDIGLLGYLPNGEKDTQHRVFNANRNALMADLLITTGMRIQEASSLFTREIPSIPSLSYQSIKLPLPSVICKGEKPRTVRLPINILKRIHRYVSVERSIHKRLACNELGVYEGIDDPLRVIAVDNKYKLLEGNSKPLPFDHRYFAWNKRRRVVEVVNDKPMNPALLFLSSMNGGPMKVDSWKDVFDAANKRCKNLGINIHIHPHTLRHTFAIYTLSELTRQHLGTSGMAVPGNSLGWKLVDLVHLQDPLRKLQILMGHTHISSTIRYLDYLGETEAIVDEAIGAWYQRVVD